MASSRSILLSLFLLGLSHLGYGQVQLPPIFRDSMILQRDRPVMIWGTAAGNEQVTISIGKKKIRTKPDASGNWRATMPAMPAGGPHTIRINERKIEGVLFGDVYFCSGQSNMAHQLNIHDVTYAREIATANYPQIRHYFVPTTASLTGISPVMPAGEWKSAVGEDVRPFSAVAYFFAKELYERNGVPIGLINSSVGGSPIAAWISEDSLKQYYDLHRILQRNKDTAWISRNNAEAARISSSANNIPDAGLTGEVKWFDPGISTHDWKPINVPGYWEDQGVANLNGTVWYRLNVTVPASMTGKPAGLFLGRIVDADEVYINGKRIGNTTYLYPQRRYKLPAGVLVAGINTIVVRVSNYGGKGGFVPDKPYCLYAGADTVDLKGTWSYKVGSVFNAPASSLQSITTHYQPAALYNAMVAPFLPYAIKGVCWYQGESDTGNPGRYALLMKTLIRNWRTSFRQPQLPFLFVQLPGFMDYQYMPVESNWAKTREAQASALSLPHTAMAVAIDLGEWNDVHPENKLDVGKRLALAARKLIYGEKIIASGPIFAKSSIRDSTIIIEFENAQGLATRDGGMIGDLAIAGTDKKFVWAKSKIENDKLIVWSDSIQKPMYVRYAWADCPISPNLINETGLPAAPFAAVCQQ